MKKVAIELVRVAIEPATLTHHGLSPGAVGLQVRIMPNGHGGIPRWGSPVMALVALAVVFRVRANHGVTWMVYLAIPLAALLGWRLSWHLFMYPIMEYGGSYTSVEQLHRAERHYRLGALVFAVAAIAVTFWLWRRFGW